MFRLTPVSQRFLVKRLQELGFEGPLAGGKHPQMRREDVTVIIPNSHEGDIRWVYYRGYYDKLEFLVKNG